MLLHSHMEKIANYVSLLRGISIMDRTLDELLEDGELELVASALEVEKFGVSPLSRDQVHRRLRTMRLCVVVGLRSL